MTKRSDREIAQRVIHDALSGAGGMYSVRRACGYLQGLIDRFGDDFDLQAGKEAMEKLSRHALMLKSEIEKMEAS